MKKMMAILVLLSFSVFTARAQWQDDFSDGNFTANPPWTGNTGDWLINAAGQLQSSNQVVNSSFYLSTPSTMVMGAEWSFFVRLNFNTSSTNYMDVFLTASAGDLTAASTTGYFIRIGNTQDEVSLYRKDASGITKIIDGADGITGASDNLLRIKVVRTGSGLFTLFRDAGGTGNNYVSEGSVVDNLYTASAFFGVLVRQSTSGFFGRHYLDDISVRPYLPDTTPPSLVKAVATSARELDIYFSEPIDPASALVLSNYAVDNGIGLPVLIQVSGADHSLVHAVFGQDFSLGISYTIAVQGVQDVAGNAMPRATASFDFYYAQRYDIIIDEIMADPSPPVGLPNAEYIELKNRSSHTLDLSGWRIATETATSAPFPSYRLPPDSFLVITGTSQAAAFRSYGNNLGIGGFPSLDNDAALLSLVSGNGTTIHAVAYSSRWYETTVKKQGGWSLEMIDTDNPCSGETNWRGSTDAHGGTPARKNAVAGINTDRSPPQLLRTTTTDSTTIIALFDEPLDSAVAAAARHYSIDNNQVMAARPLVPLFNSVSLSVSSPLQKQKTYTLQADGVTDCRGNRMEQGRTRTGWSEAAVPKELIINELLFDPPPGAVDFVELYNRSSKIIDAHRLYLGNRNSSGQVDNLQNLSPASYLIFPGDYLLLTTDLRSLRLHYLVSGVQLQLASLPSFPDDTGAVVLADEQGSIIDELDYSVKWHFSLITNPQGVSLERIDPAGVSQDENNWHSAASTAGYATPGYKNSQYYLQDEALLQLEVSPKVCSPDNDGRDDAVTITYAADAIGYVANISIFDVGGRSIRRLVKNELMGMKGRWLWDGLDENHRKLPPGSYIIYAELFNLRGKRKTFRQVVVIAPDSS